MNYTKRQILDMVNERPMLYQKPCVNYRGKTDEGVYYTEVIAEAVCAKLKRCDEKILGIRYSGIRTCFNFAATHKGAVEEPYSEATFCRQLYVSEIEGFGKVIDYQVNLIKGAPVSIDLITYDNGKVCTLVEVKGHESSGGVKNSDETLLRCMLEIESYYRILSKVEREFKETHNSNANPYGLKDCREIRRGIYVPKGSQAHSDYLEMQEGKRPHLKELYDLLGFTLIAY